MHVDIFGPKDQVNHIKNNINNQKQTKFVSTSKNKTIYISVNNINFIESNILDT